VDLALKRAGGRIPKAFGFAVSAIAQLKVPGIPAFALDKLEAWLTQAIGASGAEAGAGIAIMFFPDTCELGAFSVEAGYFDESSPNGFTGYTEEGGVQAGGFAGFEFAVLLGPGPASASSFKGIFWTAQASVANVGASGYFGETGPEGTWYGGTLGFAPSPGQHVPTAGTVAWDYDLLTVFSFNGWFTKCVCYELIRVMP
jgi:hypothetical protein